MTVEPSNLRAVREIAGSPGMLAEAKAALPAIRENATAPAGPAGVAKVISSMFVTYPQPQRSEAEWATFWTDYNTVLAGCSLSSLDAAKGACLHNGKFEFLPKPGKFLELARMTENRAVRAYDRARQAVEFQEPVPRESIGSEAMAELLAPIGRKPVEKTPAEKEAVRAAMRKFIEQDDARRAKEVAAKRVNMPDTSAAVEQGHITPQMRKLLGSDHNNVTQPPRFT